jgi:hypothetical protein
MAWPGKAADIRGFFYAQSTMQKKPAGNRLPAGHSSHLNE